MWVMCCPPVVDVAGAPDVHVRVQRRDQGVVQRKLHVVEVRQLSQKRQQAIGVYLETNVKVLLSLYIGMYVQ